MDDYLLNYYSVSLEFINEFRSVQYKGIPLALFVNLHDLCGHDHAILQEKSLRGKLKVRINNADEVQKGYNAILDSIMDGSQRKPNQVGKVMLYDHVLSGDTILPYLDPTGVFVITPHNVLEKLKGFKVDTRSINNELLQKAANIFEQHQNHPFFSQQGFQLSMLHQRFPQILDTLSTVERFLHEYPISCVIVGTTTDYVSRILTVAARQKGIPSICLQHGVIGIEEEFMPVFATKNAVYGRYEKRWYVKRGVSESQIVITGHPKFHRIYDQPRLPKNLFQHMLGVNPQKKSILVVTTTEIDVRLVAALIENLMHDADAEILLRPHPHEFAFKTVNAYNPIFNRHPNLKLVSKVFPLDILHHVDLVIGIDQSTMSLEAMLLNKPVLILKSPTQDPLFVTDFYDEMGRFVSSDPKAIAKMAIDLLSPHSVLFDENRRKRNEFVASRYPVKASMNAVLDLIRDLTGISYEHPYNKPFSG